MLTPDIYLVPGDSTEQVTVTFDLTRQETKFKNEVGVFVVDDAAGTVDGQVPGTVDYARAVFHSADRQVLFPSGGYPGVTQDITVTGGTYLAFYLVKKHTSALLLSHDHPPKFPRSPKVYFSSEGQSHDHFDHAHSILLPNGSTEFDWKDKKGGKDHEYNDSVYTVTATPQLSAPTVGLVHDTGVSTTDRLTSDPTLDGTASVHPGNVLEATFDGGGSPTFHDVTATIVDGTYTLTAADLPLVRGSVLTDGTYTLQVRVRDAAGHVSPTGSVTFTIDSTIASPSLTLANDTGSSDSDGLTSDPMIQGTAADSHGLSVLEAAFDKGGTPLFQDITGKLVSGAFTLEGADLAALFGSALVDGSYRLLVRARDNAGNVSGTMVLEFVLDQTVAAPNVALQNDTGVSDTDHLTSDPTLDGTAADANGVAALEAALGGSGAPVFQDITNRLLGGVFTLTMADLAGILGAPLADGSYQLLVRARDAAGNLSAVTTLSFTLDTSVNAPTVMLTDDTGVSSTDWLTTDPTIQGTAADVNGVATVEAAFDLGGAPAFRDITDKLVNGTFTLSTTDLAELLGFPLADGHYLFRARTRDAAGNVSGDTALTFTFTLDTTVGAPTLALANDTGTSHADGLTSDPTVQGTATDANGLATLEAAFDLGMTPVFHDVTPKLTDGAFTLTGADLAALLGSALSDGDYRLLVQTRDNAGNISGVAVLMFTLDTTIAVPSVALANDTGSSHTDRLTSDPTIQGMASDSNRIATLEAAFDLGTTLLFHDITNKLSDGTFTLTPADLAVVLGVAVVDDNYRFVVRARDTAGNLSAESVLTFTLVPDAAVGTVTFALANDTGASNTDRLTSDPTIQGMASASSGIPKLEAAFDTGATLVFHDISGSLSNGAFTLTPTTLATILGTPLANGNYRLVVRTKDGLGNVIGMNVLTFTLDTTATAPAISLANDTGASTTDRLTSNPTIQGTTTDAQAIVALEAAFDVGGPASFHDVTNKLSNRAFTLTLADLATVLGSPLSDGVYHLLVRARDAAGNLSNNASLTFTLDTTVTAPSLSLATDTGNSSSDRMTSNPTAQGAATDLNGVMTLEAAFDIGGPPAFHDVTGKPVNGAYTLTAADLAIVLGASLADGTQQLLIRLRDMAGNLSGNAALTFTFDTTVAPPTAALLNDTGVSNADLLTSDAAIQGTATDPHGIVTLEAAFDLGTTPVFHDVTARLINGAYTLNAGDLAAVFGGPLVNGTYQLLVRARDTAGNLSTSTSLTFTLDTAIAAPTISLVNDTGVSNADRLTSDAKLQGTAADAHGIVKLEAAFDLGATPVFHEITAKLIDGAFVLGPSDLAEVLGSPLVDGNYRLLARVTDAAGNLSGDTALTFTFTLDTVVGSPTLALVNDTGTSNNDRLTADPTIHGTAADVNGIVTLEAAFDVGGAPVYHDITSKLIAGVFTLSAVDLASILGLPLSDGDYRLLVRARDNAGNLSSNAALVFTLDTSTPAPTISLAHDTGASSTDRLTSDPTIQGTAADSRGIYSLEAAFDIGPTPVFVDVTDKLNASSFTLSFPELSAVLGTTLTDGSYTVLVRAKDAAGNVAGNVALQFTLDTNPPSVPAFHLDTASDSTPVGDDQTILHAVTLVGSTDPGVVVTLQPNGNSTSSDATGFYSFANLPLIQGENTFTASATDLAGNISTYSRAITQIDACGFENGLTDWTVDQSDGSAGGHGSVSLIVGSDGDNQALIKEGDSFLVTLRQTFAIPATPSVLTIAYDNLNFDATDSSSVNDAFEAALVDAQGNPLVHPFMVGADAFFNITEDLPAAFGSETSVSGTTITVDVSRIAPGTAATLILRLVNNDTDAQTNVTIACVQFHDKSVVTTPLLGPEVIANLSSTTAVTQASTELYAALQSAPSSTSPTVFMTSQSSPAPAASTFSARPLVFEPNLGQADGQVQFLTRGNNFTTQFLSDGAVFTLAAGNPNSGDTASANGIDVNFVHMHLIGGNAAPVIEGENLLSSQSNYFVGSSEAEWVRNVPNFSRVVYHDAYQGIDLVYYGSQQQLEYDFVVAPGADPSQIALTFDGADVSLNSARDLIVHTANGDFVEHAPILYQMINGSRAPIAGSYQILDNQQVVFEVGAYDSTQRLYIDPVLAYSSFFGGSADDGARITSDSDGNMFIAINTSSTDLPLLNAIQPTKPGQFVGNLGDAIGLAKFDRDGSLLFSTYFGGSGGHDVRSLELDPDGNPIVLFNTSSTNLPVHNALQPNNAGAIDTAVVKFRADGSELMFSTYLGGPNGDLGLGMAVDAAGNIYVTGQAGIGFPTKNAFQPNYAGGIADAFVCELNSAGTDFVYSTFLGGGQYDCGFGIAVDDQGSIYATGLTGPSGAFPTKGAFQSSYGGGTTDVYVAKIAPGGSGLVYASYLGGSAEDRGLAIAVDQQHDAYIAGFTLSDNFPAKNAFQSTLGGGARPGDAFVTKVNPAGDSVVYSTYIGGQVGNEIDSIQVDSMGSVYFLTVGDMRNRANATGLDFDYGGPTDPFIGQLSPSGQKLIRAVYLRSNSGDNFNVHLGPPGVIYFAGTTTSPDFPTVNAFQPTKSGGSDAVFGRLILVTPSITIQSPPAGGQYLVGTKLLITGTASGPVLVNGIPVDAVDSAGEFFSQITVAPGTNTFIFTTTDQNQLSASGTLTLTGKQLSTGQVDLSQFTDVTGSLTGIFTRTSFNERTNTLLVETAVRNSGQYATDVPLLAGVERLSSPTVYVRGQAGNTPDGIPYYDYSDRVGSSTLAPDAMTGAQTLSFYDSDRTHFQFDLVLLGVLNQAPSITSLPAVEAVAERPYRYLATATDPNDDQVTFSLISGPPTMTVDEVTGLVRWEPTSADVGTQVVILQVADGRGGFAQQRYVLSVINSPANRPPVIISIPVVEGRVNSHYAYQVTASDADGDSLQYSLVSPPSGMTIDAITGLISWNPTSQQVGTPPVSIQVTDEHDGLAVQQYQLRIDQEVGNHSPIIVTNPVTDAAPAQPYQYDVNAIDPDQDALEYSLTQSPPGMVIDSTTGLISWDVPNAYPLYDSAFRFGSTGEENAQNLKVDAAGNVIIFGSFQGTVDFDLGAGTYNLTSVGSHDMYLAKYTSMFHLLWAEQIQGSNHDFAYDLATDAQGNIYAAGYFDGSIDFDPGPNTQVMTSRGGVDGFILKLNQDGNYQWSTQFGSTGTDTNLGVAVDAEGNVYTCGHFEGTVDFDSGTGVFNLTSAGGTDGFVAKLDASGNFQWASRYGSPGGTSSSLDGDSTIGIAVDDSGDVYTTGEFGGTVDFDPSSAVFNLSSAGGIDIYVQKLDSDGHFEWASRFGGFGFDQGRRIAVDGAGNVFSTGIFAGAADFDPSSANMVLTAGGPRDSYVLKLDPTGKLDWVKQIGGPGDDSIIQRMSIAVNDQGDVYTSGAFQQSVDFDPGPGVNSIASAGNYNGYAVKLNSAGEFEWAVAPGSSPSLATGPGGTNDAVGSVALGPNGEVYLSVGISGNATLGPNYPPLNLSTAGSLDGLLVKLVETPRVTVQVADGRGGIDSQTFDIDITLNRPPQIISAPMSDGFEDTLYQYDVDAIDPDDDPLSYSLVESPAGMTIDSQSGVITWPDPQVGTAFAFADQIGGTGSDQARQVATDQDGNVYATGVFSGLVDFDPGAGVVQLGVLNQQSAFVAKYRRDGSLIWARAVGDAFAGSLAVDDQGDVTVVGTFTGTVDFDPGAGSFSLTSSGSDLFVWKLDAAGSLLWAEQAGPGIGLIGPGIPVAGLVALSISSGPDGSVDIVGAFQGTADFDPGAGVHTLTAAGPDAAFILKLDVNGQFQWVRQLGDESGGITLQGPHALSIDPEGNLLLSGGYYGTVDMDPGASQLLFASTLTLSASNNQRGGGFVLKLDPAGALIWARDFHMLSGSISTGDLAVDGDGNIYVGSDHFQGSFDADPGPGISVRTSTANSHDLFLIKLDRSGAIIWLDQFGSAGDDVGNNVEVDASGSIYFSGSSGGGIDFDPGAGVVLLSGAQFIIKLTPDNELLWAESLAGGTSMTIDSMGDIYTCGTFLDPINFGAGNPTLNSGGSYDGYFAAYRQASVVVRVDDGRGGFGTQTFAIDVHNTSPAEISGTVFNDLNGNGAHNWGQMLVSAPGVEGGTALHFDAETLAFMDIFIPEDSGNLENPFGMAFGPDGDLYVTSAFDGSVLRFDGSSGEFIGTLVVAGSGGLQSPTDLLFLPDGNLLVADNFTGRILKYDGRSGAFLSVFVAQGAGGVSNAFNSLDLGPDGLIYASSSIVAGINRVDRFNVDTGAFVDSFIPEGLIAPIPPYGGISDVAFGREGDLYVLDRAQGRILRFDGKTGQFIDVFISGDGLNKPHGFVFGPDGCIYVANEQGSSILKFDGITGSLVDSISTGTSRPERVVFSPDAEPTLPDWIVYLDTNGNGHRDLGERFTTSDLEGNYSFANLAPGDYTVREELQSGWIETVPIIGAHFITVSSGQVVSGVDFGDQASDEPPSPVPNHPPRFTSTPITSGTIGALFRFDATAIDPDNDPLTFDLVVKPAGMAVDASSGVVVWVPTVDQIGDQDVVLRVQDGRGGIDLQAFRIAVTQADSTPIITSTPRGPAVVAKPWQYLVTAQDADDDVLRFSLETHPAGMFIDSITGLVQWTPGAAQVGGQTVEIIADDGHGAATTQSFTLPVVATAPNDAPVIASAPRGRIRLGDQYLYQVMATDPNGDPLAYSLQSAPVGMSIDSSGLVSWVPVAGQFGTNSVTMQVADGRGGIATQVWTISVLSQTANQPPAITSNPGNSATVGRIYAYDLLAVDLDNDPLVYSLDAAPIGMSIDPALGKIRWTPNANQTGLQQVGVRVLDVQGGYSTQTFDVSVRAVNVPPNIISVPLTSATVNGNYVYAVRAFDPEGDSLTFNLDTAPSGMTINADTGLINWSPTSAQIGARNVSVTVDDGQGGHASQNWTVVVTATSNHLPIITSTPGYAAAVSAPYQYQVTAADADGDTLLFTLLAGPAGMTIDPLSGLVRWTPTANQVGLQSVIVVAIDPSGVGGTQSFSINVADNNQSPTISSHPLQVILAGLSYRYDVQFADPDGDPLSLTLDQAPAGMTLDQSGRLRWSPGIADIGTHRVDLTVEDNRGAFITQSFDLVVLADQQTPRVNLIVDPNPAELGSLVTFIISATDNVGVVSLGLTINGQPVPLDAHGRISFIADTAGEYDVVASATDAAGNTGLATTMLSVIDSSDAEAPEVDLTLPLDGATIAEPFNVVGTASDSNLLYYSVSVAPVDSDDYMEMFRGTTSITDGVLGKFDPTSLANGAYKLQLKGVDVGGNISTITEVIDVSGNLKVGNFTLSFTDLTVPVAGVPITVSRTYDSLNAGQSGELGFGWRLEFRDTDLRTSVASSGAEAIGVYNAFREGTRVYLTLPGGRREGFTFHPAATSGFGGLLFGMTTPVFTPDPGVTDQLSVPDTTLIRNRNGDFVALVNGGTLPYNPADALNFGGTYYLTTKDGLQYTIDAASGDLTQLSDANGNVLTFSEDAIASNSGSRITFEHDLQGRITAAIDPAGNRVEYGYDARGDLVAVTDRMNNVTQFVYGAAQLPHYLNQVIDPLGRSGVRTEYDANGRLIQLLDVNGNAVTLAHDPDHSIETVVDALGNPTTYEYDGLGNVVAEVNALGQQTTRTYDGDGNMLTETNGLNETTTYTYDSYGNLLTVTDPVGNVTRNTYIKTHPGFFDIVRGVQPVSLLATVTDPLGNTTINEYAGTNLVRTTDAAGNVTSFTYDGRGNQTSIVDALGHTTFFVYDDQGHLTQQTDSLGRITTYTYDANGNQLTQTTTVTGPGGPRSVVTTTQYDANGRVVASTDAEGNTTFTEYNAVGQQSAIIDALGRKTQFVYDARGELIETILPDNTPATDSDNPRTSAEYDAAGHAITRTDEAGRSTHFVYDVLGRLVETLLPDSTPADLTDNPRTRTEYDAAGRVSAQIDERNNRTEFDYDADGRQITIRDALGNETHTTYDATGRVVATTDALGHITQFVLDALGRQTQTLFMDGSTTSTGYDALWRAITQTDQLGRVTAFEYDAQGRLTAVVDALHQRTEYGYDEAGNLVTQTDANGHITRYEYDRLGRKTATVLPLGQRSTTQYDANGNVASTTDFNGDTITFEYDGQNRLTAKQYPDGSSVTYTYTLTGQTLTELDSRGTTSFAYDERGHLTSRTDPDGTQISYTYDAVGNRTSVTTPAGTTSYTFDADNRTSSVTDPSGDVTTYGYNPIGNLRLTQFPNNTTEIRTYDDLNRLVSLVDQNSTGVIASYEYTLAPTGRRDAVVEIDGRHVTYGYDALDRLVSEAIVDPANGNRTIVYTYDRVGNRLTHTDTGEGTTTSTYDANDRLRTELLNGIITTYTYNASGDTLTKSDFTNTTTYYWDFDHRLIAADTNGDGSADVTNKYNPEGLRVSQTANGQETRYLLDTVQPYAQVLLEYSPSGVAIVSYVYGNDLITQTRPDGTGKSFYLVDGLGSTRSLTNQLGATTDRYAYDAFGTQLVQTGSTVNRYLFAGEQKDSNSTLYYLRARYLRSEAGRFLSRDGFPQRLTTPTSLNRYQYVGNDAVNATDPSGNFTLSEQLAVVAILPIVSQLGFSAFQSIFRGGDIQWDGELVFGSVELAGTHLGVGALVLKTNDTPDRTTISHGWFLLGFGESVSPELPFNGSLNLIQLLAGLEKDPSISVELKGFGLEVRPISIDSPRATGTKASALAGSFLYSGFSDAFGPLGFGFSHLLELVSKPTFR